MVPRVIPPHCHSDVPYSAKFCRGCPAEIEYGTPRAALLFVVFVALFAAWYAGLVIHAVAGWAVLSSLLAGGVYGCAQLFRNRVNIKRIYRTQLPGAAWVP